MAVINKTKDDIEIMFKNVPCLGGAASRAGPYKACGEGEEYQNQEWRGSEEYRRCLLEIHRASEKLLARVMMTIVILRVHCGPLCDITPITGHYAEGVQSISRVKTPSVVTHYLVLLTPNICNVLPDGISPPSRK